MQTGNQGHPRAKRVRTAQGHGTGIHTVVVLVAEL